MIHDFKVTFAKPVDYFVQNVFSMTNPELRKFSSALAVRPYLIDRGNFTYAVRKRLYWMSWSMSSSKYVDIGQD